MATPRNNLEEMRKKLLSGVGRKPTTPPVAPSSAAATATATSTPVKVRPSFTSALSTSSEISSGEHLTHWSSKAASWFSACHAVHLCLTQL